MEDYFIIKVYDGNQTFYLQSSPDSEELHTNRAWTDSIFLAYRFKTNKEAFDLMLLGRSKYHWRGIFQIKQIYISK